MRCLKKDLPLYKLFEVGKIGWEPTGPCAFILKFGFMLAKIGGINWEECIFAETLVACQNKQL